MSDKKPIGVVGAGSFGTAIANLLAENNDVLIFARRQETVDNINIRKENLRQAIDPRITATNDITEVARQCDLIFPTLPSSVFKEVLTRMSPHLRPDHILIHGTKGLHYNVSDRDMAEAIKEMGRDAIQTVSELIMAETPVLRVGCISGPNLATELAQHKPAGTVIASHFDEVIKAGRDALKSERFQVYGNHDLIGVELAGALKNIIALSSGTLSGMELGDNARALLITKSLSEVIRIGNTLGGHTKTFLGLAGIGDIIATSYSPTSRNYTFGYRLAKGETVQEILDSSEEVAEGINTVEVVKHLADKYRVRVPIIQMIYRVIFDDMTATEALSFLMKYPFDIDVDYLD